MCAFLHNGLHRPSLTSHTRVPAPTTAKSHNGAASPTGVWAYTRTLHRAAAEALKIAIFNHQGLVHTPHDNTRKGYTLWWHHPASEGGLQPPADQPGIGPDHTAVAHAVAAMAQQVGAQRWARVCASLHDGLHRPSLTSHTRVPAPTTAESHTGAASPTGVWAYTRTLHCAAAEALKIAISNHQGLVHTPDDNTRKGYTLWWHHPALEGGLQPPADQPGISPDLTAVAHAVAAMAQQVGAPPQWAPSVIREAAFAHFRGRPIHPPLQDVDPPANNAWAVHILVPHDTGPKSGDATARVTKQLPNTALHYDIPTPNVVVTHNTGRDHYYLHATQERSPITIYTFTTYPGLQLPRRHPRPAWKHPLHVAPTPRKRPAHHAPPPADSTSLHQTGRGTPSKPPAPTHQRWTQHRHRSHPQKHLEPTGPHATPQNGTGGHTLGILWRKPHGRTGGPPHHHPPQRRARWGPSACTRYQTP